MLTQTDHNGEDHTSSQYLTTSEVAGEFRIPESTLRAWRRRRLEALDQGTDPDQAGPPYYRMGPQGVRYKRAELDDWLTRCRV